MFPVLQHSITIKLAFVPIAPMSAARLPFGKRRFAKITQQITGKLSKDKVVSAHVL
jgi:hypothetical protein